MKRFPSKWEIPGMGAGMKLTFIDDDDYLVQAKLLLQIHPKCNGANKIKICHSYNSVDWVFQEAGVACGRGRKESRKNGWLWSTQLLGTQGAMFAVWLQSV